MCLECSWKGCNVHISFHVEMQYMLESPTSLICHMQKGREDEVMDSSSLCGVCDILPVVGFLAWTA